MQYLLLSYAQTLNFLLINRPILANVSFKAQFNFQFYCGCFQVKLFSSCIHLHLIEEQLPSLLFPQVHLLHGHLFAAMFLAGDAHNARGAFADFDETVQVFPGVPCK